MYSAAIACFGKPAREGGAQRGIPVRLQQVMQPLDVVDPRPLAAVDELREVRQRGRAQIQQMLALEVAPRPRARHRGHALGAMLGQDRFVARVPLPDMLGPEASRDDADAIGVRRERPRQPDRVGGIE